MKSTPKVITNKKLMEEWDYEKNNALGYYPENISLGSGIKVWWRCPKGHAYDASVTNRNRGRGCKYCAGKAVLKGFNDLESQYPDIAKEWHPSKNGDLKPDMITYGSGRKVWWLCSNNHSYEKVVRDRSKGAGCPICTAALKTSFPEQAVFFYIKKVFPDAISRYKEIFDNRMELDIFIPSRKVGIEYDGAAFHDKDHIFKDNRKYEICKANGISLIRIMEQSRSMIFVLYDHKIVLPNSNRKHLNNAISELCYKLGHPVDVNVERDKFEILDYVYARKESLASEYPEVAKEWDYEANYPRKPEDFAPHSNETVGWVCSKCGNKWSTMINSRTGSHGTGCPKCSPREMRAVQITRKIEETGSLADLYPELMEEWDYEKNDIDPKTLLPGSKEEVYWICKKCGNRWKATVVKRALNGHGCRLCTNQEVVTGINDLATTHPEILREWDYEKNAVQPTEVAARSNKYYQWKCPKCGYEWAATLNNRIGRNSGCPCCSGRVPHKGVNDFKTLYPEYAEDWDYDKNTDLPEDYKPGSHHKAYWKCKKCEYEWYKTIHNRVRNPACPRCRNHFTKWKAEKRNSHV